MISVDLSIYLRDEDEKEEDEEGERQRAVSQLRISRDVLLTEQSIGVRVRACVDEREIDKKKRLFTCCFFPSATFAFVLALFSFFLHSDADGTKRKSIISDDKASCPKKRENSFVVLLVQS